MENVQVYDVVRVSHKKLIGEVIELRGDLASIQVYEETAGIGPGEPVYYTNQPLSAELGPGLIESIFDGIQRPLTNIYEATDLTFLLELIFPASIAIENGTLSPFTN
jgi:V/A-type H+-transporting ATPase subunit A